MSQPLGVAVGNALEVARVVAILHGGGPADARELTLDLAAVMLSLAGAALDPAAARARVERALADGSAWERMVQLVEAQGGDPRSLEEGAARLHPAPVVTPVKAARTGALARWIRSRSASWWWRSAADAAPRRTRSIRASG